MKIFFALLFGLLFSLSAVAAGLGGTSSGVGGYPASPTFSGTVSSTKPCNTGFSRVGPNFCRTNGSSFSTWTDATACTGRTFGEPLPADAKMALMVIHWRALSNNAIAARSNDVFFWSSSSCTGRNNVSNFSVREFAAVAAGTVLADGSDMLLVRVPVTNTFYATQTNAGGNGNADIFEYFLVGYID